MQLCVRPLPCLKPSSLSGVPISLFTSLCKYYQPREAVPDCFSSVNCWHFLPSTQPHVHILACTVTCPHIRVLQPPPPVLFSDIIACFLNCICNMWFCFWVFGLHVWYPFPSLGHEFQGTGDLFVLYGSTDRTWPIARPVTGADKTHPMWNEISFILCYIFNRTQRNYLNRKQK